MTALSLAHPGKLYTIKWNFSRNDYVNLMEQLGLIPGATLFLMNSFFGNVIISVNGKRIALDKDLAFYIKV